MTQQATVGRDTPRSAFPCFVTLATRWMDNDIYGHVNNVHYYSYFDTAVNGFLVEKGVLDIHHGEIVAFVVETGCTYFGPVAFPDTVSIGFRVIKIGNSSVRYQLALYRNEDPLPAAAGHFTHVYVERASGRPCLVPDAVREVLAGAVAPEAL
ncbi:acyl-CoA thioesterase [Herbaspirillum sp. alder98]|uniref:acyl-CoA thioesterase n=1 Tax=Herbaspirillum sp. alder98 TaxID=2913096 RepID=UPI001CD86383|nr:thioesterase family protein [Herbaspirillum sp. alder98]MCA1326077.1 acyl-CoA thioesterase [Herbaspirillum sp. alder98]